MKARFTRSIIAKNLAQSADADSDDSIDIDRDSKLYDKWISSVGKHGCRQHF